MTYLSQLRGFNMLLKRLKLSSSGTVDFVMTDKGPSSTKTINIQSSSGTAELTIDNKY